MLFRRKRGMIDVRELQKRGVVRIPNKDIVVPTNKDGFVEFGTDGKTIASKIVSTTPETQTTTSNTEFFGFMDTKTPPISTSQDLSTESNEYNKKEVDTKMTELDNKVYKLEQRIELLEKKLDINHPQETNTGIMGW